MADAICNRCGYMPDGRHVQDCPAISPITVASNANEPHIRDLKLLAKLRAHPAIHWHLTDIEGARDAAESPEAREVCEMTMQLPRGA